MAERGGPAALKGYRLQTLYALHRAFAEGKDAEIVLKLEGVEDLEVRLRSGEPLEFIQVKAYCRDLALSHLQNSSGEGSKKRPPFLKRALEYSEQHPRTKIRLVSFGRIGPELKQAWEHDSPNRDSTCAKLKTCGYRSADIKRLFGSVTLEEADEETICREVLDHLKQSMVGSDPMNAFELLSY